MKRGRLYWPGPARGRFNEEVQDMNPLKVISWAVSVCGLCSLVVVPVCAGGGGSRKRNERADAS